MNEEYFDCIKQNGLSTDNIVMEEDIELAVQEIASTRRPLVLIHGKQLTHEQVVTLIANEEPLFHNWDCNDNKCPFWDSRNERGVLKNIFYRSGYNWLSSWVYSDGIIGGHLLEFKYPEFDEWAIKWLECAKRNSFLDITVSYTNIDEHVCFGCRLAQPFPDKSDKECVDFYESHDINNIYYHSCHKEDIEKCRKMQKYLKGYTSEKRTLENIFEIGIINNYELVNCPESMADNVQITLWIHDGVVEFLCNKSAKDKYDEYRKAYSFDGSYVLFGGDLFHNGLTCIADEKLIKECFVKAGLSEDKYEESVLKKFITKAEGLPITKEWVINEYNRFKSKYKLEW